MGKMTITREYNSEIDRVWEALTTPEQIVKFWAPPGMEAVDVSIDKLEVGGIFKYSMKSPEGFQQWVKSVYEKIEKPNLLSFREGITDAEGNYVAPSHYGMPGDEPKQSLTEIHLEETETGTKVSMIIDYGDDQSNEFASMGWKGMLENLASVVE